MSIAKTRNILYENYCLELAMDPQMLVLVNNNI